jgi:hypothetical protein
MEFQVPQIEDVEDKIFGDFSFFQAVYLAGGIGLSYIVWVIIPDILTILKLPLVAGICALAMALTFIKKDTYGKPFIDILEAVFMFYIVNPKLYTWKKIPKKRIMETDPKKRKTISVTVPNISESNLKNLTWGMDVKGGR